MNILAVDATGEILSAAIDVDGRVVNVRRASKKHDEALLPAVEALLRKAGLEWSDLDAIAAARGPGRFTGIRIGMSFAAAAGFQLNIPALAISRLEAAADRAIRRGNAASTRRWGAAEKSGGSCVLAALPGWKDEVYHQVFRRTKAGLKAGADAVRSAPQDWPTVRAAAEKRGLVIAYGDTDAPDLLPIARRLLAAGKTPPFKPFYLQPAGYEKRPVRPP